MIAQSNPSIRDAGIIENYAITEIRFKVNEGHHSQAKALCRNAIFITAIAVHSNTVSLNIMLFPAPNQTYSTQCHN